MEIRYFKHWSSHLGRDMEFKVYGHAGKPVMFIPCQGGRFFDFENFKMIDYWAKFIEEGSCTVYAIDCIDNEAWGAQGADNRWRIENHEKWFNYVVNELVPYIKHLSGERNGYDQGIITFGASMGAMHAANLFFRRPDLFSGVFAISGLYDNKEFFPGYCDDLVYQNCPNLYLANMPNDHYYIDMYNHRKILIVCGQGAWEGPLLESTRWLENVVRSKGINAQIDYWGYDVDHDWPWWFKMVEHYVPQFLYN
ncbi:MAG: esterase family protein [Oscillospiraceae bacterium]|nr:esterase family protein [Oscillospiraceae bacterium]